MQTFKDLADQTVAAAKDEGLHCVVLSFAGELGSKGTFQVVSTMQPGAALQLVKDAAANLTRQQQQQKSAPQT